MKTKARRVLRKIFRTLAFVAFFIVLGSVGAVERDCITLTQGVWQMAAGTVCCVLFSWLSGDWAR